MLVSFSTKSLHALIFLKRLNEVSRSSTTIGSIVPRGNSYFYDRLLPDENDSKVCVREGLNGKERVIGDPAVLSTKDKHYSLGAWNISFDEKLLAYIAYANGAETGEIYIQDITTGEFVDEPLKGARYNGVAWLPDHKSFLYRRLQQLPPDAPETEILRKGKIWLHKIGTKQSEDREIFGYGINPDGN